MTIENLGGNHGRLHVEKYSNKYYFYNHTYGMESYIYKDDVNLFISDPRRKRWGPGYRSFSNEIETNDIKIMIEYLTKDTRKYDTVTDVIKSRSKYKKKYLMQFSMDELQEYIKNKEDKNEIESCS